VKCESEIEFGYCRYNTVSFAVRIDLRLRTQGSLCGLRYARSLAKITPRKRRERIQS